MLVEEGKANPNSHGRRLAALRALLGYSDREAAAALKNLPAGASVSDGIKLALKSLG